MVRRLLTTLVVASAAISTHASAQQQSVAAAPPSPVAGELFNQGYDIKTAINNQFLILQKGNRTYWCGSDESGITWANWPQRMRDAPCIPLNKQ